MITNHSIEEVALKLYVKSGNAEGHDLDNWLEAESIVWDDIEEETQVGGKWYTSEENLREFCHREGKRQKKRAAA